jgi:hypothetical protein
MIGKIAPTLCSVFKGILPSDLFQRYDDETGYEMLQFDISVAAEINERIKEQTDEMDAKRAVAKRNQRREKISSAQMGSIMEEWAGE